MFTCVYIDDTPYLDIYMAEECWIGDHLKYITVVAIPSFILWGIGLPFLAFIRLFKLNAKEKLYTRKTKKIYGFLFLGY